MRHKVRLENLLFQILKIHFHFQRCTITEKSQCGKQTEAANVSGKSTVSNIKDTFSFPKRYYNRKISVKETK